MIHESDINNFLELVEKWKFTKYPSIVRNKLILLLNRWTSKYDAIEARETAKTLVEFKILEQGDLSHLKEIYNHVNFKQGSFYIKGTQVFGWIYFNQVQAIRLPLTKEKSALVVDLREDCFDIGIWNDLGFDEAIELPFRRYPKLLKVTQSYVFAGFAIACEIGQVSLDGFLYRGIGFTKVIKNFKQKGYWKANKIWEGCQEWYKENGRYWIT